ncbi:hypothetical protein MPLA_140353 [Mesorhizobium sp. ORS 3359]|nr:hypothetical protein MPLA_140353 [Mesorhizobium sp. ORS 3359]
MLSTEALVYRRNARLLLRRSLSDTPFEAIVPGISGSGLGECDPLCLVHEVHPLSESAARPPQRAAQRIGGMGVCGSRPSAPVAMASAGR